MERDMEGGHSVASNAEIGSSPSTTTANMQRFYSISLNERTRDNPIMMLPHKYSIREGRWHC